MHGAPGRKDLVPAGQLDKEESRFLLLAALLLPLRNCVVPGPKNKPTPASAAIVRESIKWRTKDADMSVLLHETAQQFLDIHQQVAAMDGSDATVRAQNAPEGLRVQLGMVIRKLKQHWHLGALLAPVLLTPQAAAVGTEEATTAATASVPSSGAGRREGTAAGGDEPAAEEVVRCKEVYGTLKAAANAFGLEECWQWKPLLDGKQVQALLELQKPGPELGKAMGEALNWQLAHPSGSVEECQQHVKEWWRKHKA
ncbi:hypothetical protein DUNSADRAFT_15848 [Dunaliella salina]|uniref:Uncharacterized protein n=1 Tax=Dunaliella salina TaxID=3046 RepID=A0ABQ7G4T7_DUNSA|nr:hypothetical protein DUNSADRAFT_15848 [Dunaliella salina]|eukprot:KAF5829609.1 hypothetical protein DUNSADRAFT_15848 [Dunaliella salina]